MEVQTQAWVGVEQRRDAQEGNLEVSLYECSFNLAICTVVALYCVFAEQVSE
jgi:hypothetical protein